MTTQVATFRIVNFLGLYNTRWAAIMLFMGTDVIAIYIFLQFMDKIAISLDESAMLDGAVCLSGPLRERVGSDLCRNHDCHYSDPAFVPVSTKVYLQWIYQRVRHRIIGIP